MNNQIDAYSSEHTNNDMNTQVTKQANKYINV